MIAFVLRRVASSVIVLWLVMSAVFLLVNVVGDPARATLGEKAGPSQVDAFRKRHGLDRPLTSQYGAYLEGLMTLSLGRSFQDEQPVTELLVQRVPRTLLLGAMALAFEVALGISIGVVAAVTKRRWVDALLMGTSFVGVSLPSFIVGMWFLSYFAFRLGWFPIGGYGLTMGEHLWHAVLPAWTLAAIGAGTYAQLVRSELVETLRSDYVRTARAKGLSEMRATLIHAGRNAVLPVISLVSVSLRVLVSGTVIVETIFGWPGMGRLATEAITGLDLPVVLGIVFVACAMVQAGSIVCDLLVFALDPRLRRH